MGVAMHVEHEHARQSDAQPTTHHPVASPRAPSLIRPTRVSIIGNWQGGVRFACTRPSTRASRDARVQTHLHISPSGREERPLMKDRYTLLTAAILGVGSFAFLTGCNDNEDEMDDT